MLNWIKGAKIKVTIHNPIFQIKKDNFMNTETQNYKIIVAYDGTRYKGWQVQKSTDDTIQGKLQHVLSTLAGKAVEVIGGYKGDRSKPHGCGSACGGAGGKLSHAEAFFKG